MENEFKENEEINENLNNTEEQASNNEEPPVQSDAPSCETEQKIPENEQPKKKGKTKIIAVCVLAAAIIFGFLYAGLVGGKKEYAKPIVYAKDGGIYVYDSNGKNYLVSDELSSGGTYNYYYYGFGVTVAENGQKMLYENNIDENNCFSLYMKDLKNDAKEGKGTLISDNVYSYYASENLESVIYYKASDDNTLYSFDGKNEHVIAEGLNRETGLFELSKDGSTVVYAVDGSLFVSDIKGSDKETVTDNFVTYMLTDDAKSVYYAFKNDAAEDYTIMEYKFNGMADTVSENAVGILLLENGEDLLYYTMSDAEIKYKDFVEDDCADADALIEAPQNEADVIYEAKLARDEIREKIENDESFSAGLYMVYKYSDGKSTLIYDGVAGADSLNDNGDYSVISLINTESITKVPLSYMTGLEDVELYFSYFKYYMPQTNYFIQPGKEPSELMKNTDVTSMVMSDDNKNVYFYTDLNSTTGEGSLYKAGVEDGKLIDFTLINTDVVSFDYIKDTNSLVYVTGENFNIYRYKNNESVLIFEGINGYNLNEENGNVVITTDYDEMTNTGYLYVNYGGETVKLSENVSLFNIYSDDLICYMTDYSNETNEGSLYCYNGKDAVLIGENIECVFYY